MSNFKYSTVVIGSGISGLYTALKLEEFTQKKILIITKSLLGESNSYYAQGGMVAVLKENLNDCVDSHIQDTIKAGAGLSEVASVKFISENSDSVVYDLLKFGVEFDRDENGIFKLTKEAAHSVNRILHSGGDATGREMENALCKAVEQNKNIDVFENTMAIRLITDNGTCHGVFALNENEYITINAESVVVATGGIGQIYKYTTNPLGATGDGIALCYEAGAVLRDMEFVQFHPTALAIDESKNQNRFLISEAVRGEGAKLCDKNGYYYMKDYDKREELAPRDIVARANFVQMQNTNSDCVYLDGTMIKNFAKRFPTITKKCLDYGIDVTKDLIPVAPAAHYFMGGVKTNLNGETSIKNLYAVGEVASTGLHGANRLASNSLLECVVCAYKTAQYLKENIKSQNSLVIPNLNLDLNSQIEQNELIKKTKCQIKDTMWHNVGIFRSKKSLEKALDDIKKLEFDNPQNIQEYELKNIITVSKLIIKSALKRQESRGSHYRTDYLDTQKNAKHSEQCLLS